MFGLFGMGRPVKARPAAARPQLETRGAAGRGLAMAPADAPADRRPALADTEPWLPRAGRANRPVAETAWQP